MFFLLQECLWDALLDDPAAALFAALSGLALGALLCLAAWGWGRLWNRSFRMDDAPRGAIAGFLVLLSAAAVPVFYSLGKIPESARADLWAWKEDFAGDAALHRTLQSQVFERIKREGKEDLSSIPDPTTLGDGSRWEFFFRSEETPVAVSEVFTRGAADSLAERHPSLFGVLRPDDLSSALAYQIRSQTATHPEKVFRIEDAVETVHAYFLARADSVLPDAARALRLAAAAAFLLSAASAFALAAAGAYRDIKVHRAGA